MGALSDSAAAGFYLAANCVPASCPGARLPPATLHQPPLRQLPVGSQLAPDSRFDAFTLFTRVLAPTTGEPWCKPLLRYNAAVGPKTASLDFVERLLRRPAHRAPRPTSTGPDRSYPGNAWAGSCASTIARRPETPRSSFRTLRRRGRELPLRLWCSTAAACCK
jgi:hypothetical protein